MHLIESTPSNEFCFSFSYDGYEEETDVKPYTCLKGFCFSFYGNAIYGTNNSVARACEIDPKCKAFRYSKNHGFGYLCHDLQRLHYDDLHWEDNKWEHCGFWKGELYFKVSILSRTEKILKIDNNFIM